MSRLDIMLAILVLIIGLLIAQGNWPMAIGPILIVIAVAPRRSPQRPTATTNNEAHDAA